MTRIEQAFQTKNYWAALAMLVHLQGELCRNRRPDEPIAGLAGPQNVLKKTRLAKEELCSDDQTRRDGGLQVIGMLCYDAFAAFVESLARASEYEDDQESVG